MSGDSLKKMRTAKTRSTEYSASDDLENEIEEVKWFEQISYFKNSLIRYVPNQQFDNSAFKWILLKWGKKIVIIKSQ